MQIHSQNPYDNPNGMTFGVQILLISNIAIFVAEPLLRIPLSKMFQLNADWMTHFAIWQLLTYQFIHQGLWHLICNMLGLFFLGSEVERGLGTNRFFTLYFLSGILGGLGWSLLSAPHHNCVGASGAVLGVVAAFAALYPKRELYVYGLFPIQAWLLVLLFGIYEFSQIINNAGGHIANAAHLGGGLAGYVFATITGRPDVMRKLQKKLEPHADLPANKQEINRILDKIASQGLHSLTPSERATLKQAAGKR
ncbi:MAG: rhomboid family intramembrane serine protease [Kiritimatiellaceae bacterium]|nr:rhomboid family intramembrane serine protease [Kiritimatiellaceae bacterium]